MSCAGDCRKRTKGAPRNPGFAPWVWVLLFTLLVPALQRGNAQANAGGLTGTVTDPSGAAIPGVHVTFSNDATGIVTQGVSSSDGLYTVNLAPGSYNVTAVAPGFKKSSQNNVLVEVGSTATLNIQLSVGNTTETVNVTTANAIQINTTQPQLDTMLPPSEITNLPLEINGNMRQINSFATLAPGVRTGQYGSITVEGGDPYQINSAGSYYNGLQLDTASAINSNPPYEMVDEFRVLRSTFSARYGLVQGAISYNMRSGTNNLHGDAFMIDRNSVFDSAGFFPSNFNSDGAPIAPVDQETDWGGTIGGPVVLPKLYNGHDKTFFLGSIDIFNKNQGITTVGSVPTPAMKNGDFSKFVDATGKQIPIYDPQTGQQFQCNGQLNVICTDRFDPLSKSLLQYLPDPNTAGTNFELQGNMNPVITSVPYKTQAWGLTLNHQLTPTQSIAFTWWRNHYTVVQEEDAPIVPVTNPLTGEQSGVDNANIWLVNYAKTINPNMVMTAGFAAQNKMQNYVNDNNNANFPGVTGGGTMPYISFNGQNATTPFGNSNSEHVQNYVDNIGWNVFDNLLWTKGRHTLNIGGEYHHYYQHTLSNYSAGHFSFSQAETSIPNTKDPNFAKYGSSFASFLLGLVDSASRSSVATVAYHTQDMSAYIQDDYKLTNKLTVSSGLRWDVMVPYVMSENTNVFLNPTAPNPAAGNLPGAATAFGSCAYCAGYDRAAIDWKEFGPHVGIAYSFTPKTVLQMGYYINYLGFDSAYGQGEGLGAPVSLAGLLGGSVTVNGTGSNIPGYGEWSNAQGQPVPLPTVAPTPFSQGLGVAQTIYYFDPAQNGRAPMYQAWNASIQRQLGWNTLITLSYSGNRATHLADSRYNINPISQPNASVLQDGTVLTSSINSTAAKAAGFGSPYPAFATQFGGGATVYQSLKNFPQYSNVTRAFDQAGTTFYNAFQVEADKHVGNGLTFMIDATLPSQFDNLATPEDKNNPAPEYVETSDSWETRIATTYMLPIGLGQRWMNRGAVGRWLGGWQVAGILTYNNAGPLQVTQSGEGLMNGVNRPNVVSGAKMWSGNWGSVKPYFEGRGPLQTVFSTNAFANTGNEFNLGDAKRAYTALRGPLYPMENLSAKKIFRIKERYGFTVRMDYFNAFNRTQLPYPGTNINASNFGEVNSKFAGGNRQGQIEGTFTF